MNGRWRPAALGLGTLVLCSCASASPTPLPSPSPTSGVAATQTPQVAPAVLAVATLSEGYCSCYTLDLLSLKGSQLGAVNLPVGAAPPPLDAGPGGLYYVLGEQLMRLGTSGSAALVGVVATAPAQVAVQQGPELGGLAVAPSGHEWAYLQSVSQGAAQTEQVWLGEVNQVPRLLSSLTLGVATASPEFPSGYTYQLLGWVDGAVALGEVPSGEDSFGAAAPEVSLLNPKTRAQKVLSNSQNCPVGAFGDNGAYYCLEQGGGQATELMAGAAGISTGAWPLPPGSGYGALVVAPGGGQVLLSDCQGCGASPSGAYLKSQMEVVDTTSGALSSLGPAGLVSDAWLPGGQLLATEYRSPYYSGYPGAPLSELVLVSSAGQVTPLGSDSGSQYLGLAVA